MLGSGKGGLEQAALDYAVGLHGAGADVLFLLSPGAAVEARAERAEVPTTHLSNYGAWDRLAALKLRKIGFRFGTDIIIVHGNRALCLASLARLPVPLVAVAHNDQVRHFNKADAVFCITRRAMKVVGGEYPFLAEKCYFTPNMIAERETRPRLAFDSPPRLGAIGRLVPKKGFDVWLRALFLLKEKQVGFTAVLAGDGEEKHHLLRLRSELHLEREVSFTGWTENTAAFYESIDLLCVPSHHEPFGLVMIEALSHGLPVVATKSEGAMEILADPEHGVLVEKNDPAALAEAMANVLADPQTALAMGERGRAHTLHTYGMAKRSAAMNEVLKKIVMRHQTQGVCVNIKQ